MLINNCINNQNIRNIDAIAEIAVTNDFIRGLNLKMNK